MPKAVLELQDIGKPIPKQNEALVKIYSSTVTAGDCRIITFDFARWFWLPGRFIFGFNKPRRNIPGWEFAGQIESIGKKVKHFNIGDKVFGYASGISFGSTNAEYLAISENRLVAIDLDKIGYEEASVLPIGGLTALHFLRKAKVKKGQKMLIYGASGSVGTYAVQLAKYFGAEVTAVCSRKNFDLVKSLGADYLIDYRKEDFTKNGQVYDVIFDTVIKTSFSHCVDSIKQKGIYLTLDWPIIQAIWVSLTSTKKIIFGSAADKADDLVYLRKLVENNIIKPVIDRSYPLDEAVAAYEYVNEGHKVGNVIIMNQ
ncbi:NAD(P)-dependent alcohol dehydrogenase [Allomuricauda sp. SCSIO 65647]|uniref:NAD(P)-dependent alcohol dehydrogenase n=1 Tax=Allomuricauda sp. SCSIO 65647 TaxID=2908843 RepID=UPI001F40B804|nr:NAD(P)-dependent alcohol dehydrogenase [Muricauda sp. SCSIO 65647]UJH66217.1 NAD(P)-dependent alcohol dehydrogenase [Muricauda sp. SCSIO 65647]